MRRCSCTAARVKVLIQSEVGQEGAAARAPYSRRSTAFVSSGALDCRDAARSVAQSESCFFIFCGKSFRPEVQLAKMSLR